LSQLTDINNIPGKNTTDYQKRILFTRFRCVDVSSKYRVAYGRLDLTSKHYISLTCHSRVDPSAFGTILPLEKLATSCDTMCWPSKKQKDNFEDGEKKAEAGVAHLLVRITCHQS
jgi:hypothetical protein